MAEPFPWQQAMQFAFGQLRLSPKAFWSMTMHELNAAMAAYTCAQFSEMSDYERGKLQEALLRYCELDTLAMVMIYEAWREWCSE
jgi:uncharacterized phage protein (TIGR02216 family)